MNISLNPKDEHKNPDLFIDLEGETLGIQVTQFVLRNYLSRSNQARGICQKLSNYVSNNFTPPIKINVQLCTPWESDDIPRGREKLYKRLSKVIADNISENIEILIANNKSLDFNLSRTDFKNIAESYTLTSIPNNHQSNFFGDNNVYFDYGFDNIEIFQEDIKETAVKIYTEKNNGNSDILIVWGDENQFINATDLIITQLEKEFADTSFKSVYYLGFLNILELKERVINCFRIK